MEIRGSARLYGILGHPVKHSLSPRLHNQGFAALKSDSIYIPFDVDRTGPFLKRFLYSSNIHGLSVTIPHKLWAYRASDSSDRLSQICGASNTLLIHKKAGKATPILEARNSDGPGAVQALKEAGSIRGKNILISGYGGSARAIAAQILLEEKPASIWIAGRNATKIKRFVRDLKKAIKGAPIFALPAGATSLPALPGISAGAVKTDIIIQTTPLGMSSHADANTLPVSEAFLKKGTVVFDIVYSPMMTPLLTLAKKRKCKIVYGYRMLLHQAVYQFQWFTGKKPNVAAWEKILKSDLASKNRKR